MDTPAVSQIQEVTEAMEAHINALLDLKRQHNELVPIGRLPNEVLEILFLYYRDEQFVLEPLEPEKVFEPGVVHITWVCHRFRTLCLAYPLLWTHIGDYRHRWLYAFLERSTPSPMDVYMHVNLHGKNTLKRVLQNIFRLRTLVLDGEAVTMRDRVLPRLNVPAPELLSLSLRARGYILGINTAATLTAMNHIDNAFAHQLPRLRELELRRAGHIFPHSSLMSPSLEHLALEGPYTAAEVAALLRTAPGLRTFKVESREVDSGRASAHEVFGSVEAVNLLRLSSLSIEIGLFVQVAHLLRILKVPALRSTHVVLTLSRDLAETEIFTQALSALSSVLLQSNNGAPFDSLRLFSVAEYTDLRYDCEHIVLWHTSRAGTGLESDPSEPGAPAQIEFRVPPSRVGAPDRSFADFYEHISAELPLAGVRTLTLATQHFFLPSEWAYILRPLARVEHLKLIGPPVFAVLGALVSSPFILPKLSRVAISATWYRVEPETLGAPPQLWRDLRDAAKARMKEQSRLHIAFEDCYRFDSASCEGLREFADVSWDSMGFFDDGVQDEDVPWLALLS